MGNVTLPTAQRVAAWSGYPPERILGTAEVAARFRVTRQRAGQIARTDRTFPRPGLNDGSGRAWLAAGVECWAAAHRPTADTGRFGPEAAALVLHAEQLAQRFGFTAISSIPVWHALASGVGGMALAEALRSMGLDQATIEERLRLHDPEFGPAGRSRRMTPATQNRLEAADKAVRTAGRTMVLPTDIALAFVDSYRDRYGTDDHLIGYAERRGLDTAELRRRITVVAADPDARVASRPRRCPSVDRLAAPHGDPHGWTSRRTRSATTHGSVVRGGPASRGRARADTSPSTISTGSSSSTPTAITSVPRMGVRSAIGIACSGRSPSGCPAVRRWRSCRCRPSRCLIGRTGVISVRTERHRVAPA